jgi:hypothetical protein
MTAVDRKYYATREYGGVLIMVETINDVEKWYMFFNDKWWPYGKICDEELGQRHYVLFEGEYDARQFLKDLP